MAARHLVSISLGSYSGSGANLEFKAGKQAACSPSTETDVSSLRFRFHFELDRASNSIARELRAARYRGSRTTFPNSRRGEWRILSRIPHAYLTVYSQTRRFGA